MPFDWYGRYDVVVRKEGFETIDTARWVVAPWWQWVPFDLVAAVLPVRLTHAPRLTFDLIPASEGDAGLLDRAEAQRDEHATP